MPDPQLDDAPSEGLSEEEAGGAFVRFREVLGALFRVPKEELDAKLAEKRAESRRRINITP